jgi:hypothetical protein
MGMHQRARSRSLTLKAMSKARALWCLLAFVLASCRGSTLSDQFYSGAKRQEGLDNNSLYLWERSPAIASGNFDILSSANFDRQITKTLRFFSNVSDLRAPLASADLLMNYSHVDESAPTFFKWAGKRVPWQDNPDFRVLFAYAELDRGITYVDGLMSAGYLIESASKLFAWRQAVCTGQTRGTRSCTASTDILAAPALPLTVSVDNSTFPGGGDSVATDTGFCPFFNGEYYLGSGSACTGRETNTNWKADWHSGLVRRQVSFYRDYDYKKLNLVDDGDAVIHELGHVLQTAINPALLESKPGQNLHLDAIIEGSADFFAAAYRRDDRVFRYAINNIYPIYPDNYVGELQGAERDPDNSLYFPNAYSYKSPYDIGRVISGAMNDYRKLLAGETVFTPPLAPAITPASPAADSEDAWDMAVGVLFQTFYKLSSTDLTISLNRFAGRMVEVCLEMGAAKCNSTLIVGVLKNRGLLNQRYYNPALYGARNPSAQDLILPGAAGTFNNFLFLLGQSKVAADQAELRWGLNMPKTLGWAPFLPGGSTEFANDDGVINPCEAIIVFPQITNNTQLEYWKDLTARVATATYPAMPGYITNYANIPLAERGIDFVDLNWSIAGAATGFDLFEHPTLGYIDSYTGINPDDIRGIPYLKAGEDVQTLVKSQTSRLYEIQQEKAHDQPWSSKVVTSPAQRAKLRSASGWLFLAPEDPASTTEPTDVSATLTFKITYAAYNRITHTTQSLIYSINDAKAETSASTVTQSIRVSTVDAGFCD